MGGLLMALAPVAMRPAKGMAAEPDGSLRARCSHSFEAEARTAMAAGRLSRMEVAALLDRCLDSFDGPGSPLQRMQREFQAELAALERQRALLERRIDALAAQAFAPTTRLGVQTSLVSGAVRGYGEGSDLYNAEYAAFTTSYYTRLKLSTSFTGKDLLYIRIRGANFDNAFNGNGIALTGINAAANTKNVGVIDRFHYAFPLGSSLALQIGPLIKTNDSVAVFPSLYGEGLGDRLLEFFAVAGIPGVFNGDVGGGFALHWYGQGDPAAGRWSASASYVDVNAGLANLSEGGQGSAFGGGSALAQLAHSGPRWGAAATYRHGQQNTDFNLGTAFVAAENWWLGNGHSHSVALNGYWRPVDPGWIPTISLGWAVNAIRPDSLPAPVEAFAVERSQSWFAGLQWNDAFVQGNALGVAVGQPTFATRLRSGATPADGNYAFELWYKLQLSDAIHVVPAVYYLSRPLGQLTPRGSGDGPPFSILGGFLQATLRF